MDTLRFGDKLQNGSIVISYTHKHDGGNGFHPHGLVLAYNPNNNLHPYITWGAYLDDDGVEWFCEHGNYYSNIIEAAECYRERGGK